MFINASLSTVLILLLSSARVSSKDIAWTRESPAITVRRLCDNLNFLSFERFWKGCLDSFVIWFDERFKTSKSTKLLKSWWLIWLSLLCAKSSVTRPCRWLNMSCCIHVEERSLWDRSRCSRWWRPGKYSWKWQKYLEILLITQKALPGKKTDEIPGQIESPEPPITPEYPAWYPHNLVVAKIQHS